MRYHLNRYYVIIALSAGAAGGTGIVPSFILPVLFISSPDKRNSTDSFFLMYLCSEEFSKKMSGLEKGKAGLGTVIKIIFGIIVLAMVVLCGLAHAEHDSYECNTRKHIAFHD